MPEKERVKSTRIRYIKYLRQNKRIKRIEFDITRIHNHQCITISCN